METLTGELCLAVHAGEMKDPRKSALGVEMRCAVVDGIMLSEKTSGMNRHMIAKKFGDDDKKRKEPLGQMAETYTTCDTELPCDFQNLEALC